MNPKLAFLGAGSMGTAIMGGIFRSKTPLSAVTATSTSIAGAERIVAAMTTNASGTAWESFLTTFALEVQADANQVAVKDADVIFLGTKPYAIAEVAGQIRDRIKPDAVVVSIAAGVPIANIQAVLSPGQPVVRAMPNTPALVGAGLTGVAFSADVSKATQDMVLGLFNTMGESIVVPEEQIDALTAVSGSGPAYVFYLIEQLTKVAQANGFDAAQAKKLVEQTFLGASLLLADSGDEPQNLRQKVTSPNGTTEAAITVLSAAGVEQIFADTVSAAVQRSKELAAE